MTNISKYCAPLNCIESKNVDVVIDMIDRMIDGMIDRMINHSLNG